MSFELSLTGATINGVRHVTFAKNAMLEESKARCGFTIELGINSKSKDCQTIFADFKADFLKEVGKYDTKIDRFIANHRKEMEDVYKKSGNSEGIKLYAATEQKRIDQNWSDYEKLSVKKTADQSLTAVISKRIKELDAQVNPSKSKAVIGKGLLPSLTVAAGIAAAAASGVGTLGFAVGALKILSGGMSGMRDVQGVLQTYDNGLKGLAADAADVKKSVDALVKKIALLKSTRSLIEMRVSAAHQELVKQVKLGEKLGQSVSRNAAADLKLINKKIAEQRSLIDKLNGQLVDTGKHEAAIKVLEQAATALEKSVARDVVVLKDNLQSIKLATDLIRETAAIADKLG